MCPSLCFIVVCVYVRMSFSMEINFQGFYQLVLTDQTDAVHYWRKWFPKTYHCNESFTVCKTYYESIYLIFHFPISVTRFYLSRILSIGDSFSLYELNKHVAERSLAVCSDKVTWQKNNDFRYSVLSEIIELNFGLNMACEWSHYYRIENIFFWSFSQFNLLVTACSFFVKC